MRCTYCPADVPDTLGEVIFCFGCLDEVFICVKCLDRHRCAGQDGNTFHNVCIDCRGPLEENPFQRCNICSDNGRYTFSPFVEDTAVIDLDDEDITMEFDDPPLLANPHIPGAHASVNDGPLQIGVVTWNINHFSAEEVNCQVAVKAVKDAYNELRDELLDVKKEQRKLTRRATAVLKKLQTNKALRELLAEARNEDASEEDDEDDDSDTIADDVTLRPATVLIFFRLLENLAGLKALDGVKQAHEGFAKAWASNPADVNTYHDGFDKEGETAIRKRLLARLSLCLLYTSMLRRTSKGFFLKVSIAKIQKAFPDLLGKEIKFLQRSLKSGKRLYARVVALKKQLHKLAVVFSVLNMCKDNVEWLDAILLQEVNSGDKFKSMMNDCAPLVYDKEEMPPEVILGQKLASRSASGGGSQQEYYPLVLNKGTDRPLTVSDCYLAPTSQAIQEQDNGTFEWNKTAENATYRPIVLYKVTNRSKESVVLGSVHTTPFGNDWKMDRADVYTQLHEGLRRISEKWSGKEAFPIIVGGDYYLTGEARVVLQDELSRRQKRRVVELWAEEYRSSSNRYRAERKADLAEYRELIAQGRRKKTTPSANKVEGDIRKKTEQGEKTKGRGQISGAWYTAQMNIFRNVGIDDLALTVEKTLEGAGWKVHQTVSGTNFDVGVTWSNRKTKGALDDDAGEEQDDESDGAPENAAAKVEAPEQGGGWVGVRVADFFISQRWETYEKGIALPNGHAIAVDTEGMDNARYWRLISDHFPVAGCFSTRDEDPWVKTLLHVDAKSVESATALNQVIATRKRKAAEEKEETERNAVSGNVGTTKKRGRGRPLKRKASRSPVRKAGQVAARVDDAASNAKRRKVEEAPMVDVVKPGDFESVPRDADPVRFGWAVAPEKPSEDQ